MWGVGEFEGLFCHLKPLHLALYEVALKNEDIFFTRKKSLTDFFLSLSHISQELISVLLQVFLVSRLF